MASVGVWGRSAMMGGSRNIQHKETNFPSFVLNITAGAAAAAAGQKSRFATFGIFWLI